MNEKKSCTDCRMTRLPMTFIKNVRCSRTKFLAPSPTYKCPERRGRLKMKLIGGCIKSTSHYFLRTRTKDEDGRRGHGWTSPHIIGLQSTALFEWSTGMR